MKVCFVGNDNPTPFSEYIALAKYFRDNSIDSFFLLSKKVPFNIYQKVIDSNLNFYLEQNKNGELKQKTNTTLKVSKSRLNTFPGFVKNLVFFNQFLKSQKHYNKQVKNILSKELPDVVVVYGDRGAKLIGASILFARKNNISIIDLEVAINEISFVAKHRLHRKNNQSKGINKLLSKFYQNNNYNFNGIELVFTPWFKWIPQLLLDMLPPNPWHVGDSFANGKLLISDLQLKTMVSEGGKSDNAIVVGQFSLDALFNKYQNKIIVRQNIFSKYQITEKKQEIILIALPQLFEHGFMSFDEAYKEHLYIVKSCAMFEDKVSIISLHPKMNFEDYKGLADKYSNVIILEEERLNEVLPISDYFIAAFESTISWALLVNSIGIFLEYFELGYNIEKYTSVQIIKNRKNFISILSKTIKSKEIIEKELINDSKLLPPFDGKSGERIINSLKRIVNE